MCTAPLAERQQGYVPFCDPLIEKQLGDVWMDYAFPKKRRFVNVSLFLYYFIVYFFI